MTGSLKIAQEIFFTVHFSKKFCYSVGNKYFKKKNLCFLFFFVCFQKKVKTLIKRLKTLSGVCFSIPMKLERLMFVFLENNFEI